MARIGALLVSATLMTACVSDTETALNPSTEKQSLQAVTLDQMPADSVRATDIMRRSKTAVRRTGEIYLMRGLANVFSRGIDQMAKDLRARGYDAANFSYAQWQEIADDVVARSKKKRVSYPVIIVGHSLGGNESSKFANYLAERGVPVSLIVAFDPVETGYVGPGIGKVINYYLPKSADNRILSKDGFKGEISNVDVTVDPDITHTNVDKNPEFQAATLKSIQNLTKKLRKPVVRDQDEDRGR
ncbi:MAG: hypothetical protein QNJ29_01215 [Rhizobiaceae bacterium]|nr:hypothetical protein [Rhizobiaceae bacterium]